MEEDIPPTQLASSPGKGVPEWSSGMDESIGRFDHQYRQVTIQLRVTYFLEEDTGHEPSNDKVADTAQGRR